MIFIFSTFRVQQAQNRRTGLTGLSCWPENRRFNPKLVLTFTASQVWSGPAVVLLSGLVKSNHRTFGFRLTYTMSPLAPNPLSFPPRTEDEVDQQWSCSVESDWNQTNRTQLHLAWFGWETEWNLLTISETVTCSLTVTLTKVCTATTTVNRKTHLLHQDTRARAARMRSIHFKRVSC